ncbi:MAG: hypothetical protein ACKO40_10380 [Planctomycetaceae bacterium]
MSAIRTLASMGNSLFSQASMSAPAAASSSRFGTEITHCRTGTGGMT